MIAARLGRTVQELEGSMSSREFAEWIEFLRIESGEHKPSSGSNWLHQKEQMRRYAELVKGQAKHGRN